MLESDEISLKLAHQALEDPEAPILGSGEICPRARVSHDVTFVTEVLTVLYQSVLFAPHLLEYELQAVCRVLGASPSSMQSNAKAKLQMFDGVTAVSATLNLLNYSLQISSRNY